MIRQLCNNLSGSVRRELCRLFSQLIYSQLLSHNGCLSVPSGKYNPYIYTAKELSKFPPDTEDNHSCEIAPEYSPN